MNKLAKRVLKKKLSDSYFWFDRSDCIWGTSDGFRNSWNKPPELQKKKKNSVTYHNVFLVNLQTLVNNWQNLGLILGTSNMNCFIKGIKAAVPVKVWFPSPNRFLKWVLASVWTHRQTPKWDFTARRFYQKR